LIVVIVAQCAEFTGWGGDHKGPALNVDIFAPSNRVAWCIVPFDAKKRGPEERAEMLERLGISQFAYDYRTEHITSFDAEMEALQRHRIKLVAWWFPTVLNDEARLILDVLKRHKITTQLWVMGGGEKTNSAQEQKERVETEAQRIKMIAEAAGRQSCTVGLYNHGGWFGEPENQIEIIQRLRADGVTNVGIVYNLHHGHDHLDRLPELLQKMKPHLLAINLNGMFKDGIQTGRQIIPLGQGELDSELLRVIASSGWRGPIGILNHTGEDAAVRLQENLEGLDWLVQGLRGAPQGPRPKPRTWQNYWAVEDASERAKLPLYLTMSAARPEDLTPANGFPTREAYLNWHRSHGDNGGTRYSALAQINRQNATNLEVAWVYHSKDGSNNIQCNPVIANSVMIAPTAGKFMVGVNAETGVELWRFKPEGQPAFRGLTYWRGDAAGSARVLFCSGSSLYALDPANGKPIDGFGREGVVTLPGKPIGRFGAATAAPTVFEHVIIVPGFEKDVWGFNVLSGELLWTFHTVPHPGEFGYETWDRIEDYGANCWAGMALDEKRGIAFITTGSPKPDFIGVRHRGDNLFANCVIALDASTGKRLWHFQEVRHDIWDSDISAPPTLGTIKREGKKVDVVAAVTKAGNTLLLDRVSGKPIFPFRFRRAPTSDLKGEQTAPYQPDPELPEPFAKHEFTAADITDRSSEAAEFARMQLKSATTGFFQPCSEGRPNAFLNIDGGAEWTGACVDPESGRLYVSANHMGWMITLFRDDDPPDDPAAPRTQGRNVYEQTCAQCHGTNRLGVAFAPPLRGLRHRLTDEAVTQQIRSGKNAMPASPTLSGDDLKALLDFLMIRDRPIPSEPSPSERPRYAMNGYRKFYDQEGYPANKPPWGTLNCIDLNTGKLLWKVPLGEYPKLTAEGVPITGTENYGGAIVTAGGLVFCGGTRDSKIRAFDKDNGAEVWSATLPWVGNAPPATYQVNGKQYVVIAATGGNKLGTPYGDAYVAFALKH
jgi:quinoprotein glucose dehydrogenase